jgi:hypothetical protein
MSNWDKGWRLIIHSLNVFRAYPSFLVPIFFVWIVYASGILFLRYGYSWHTHELALDLAVTFLFIFAMSFLILISFTTVLEMIRQLEDDKPSFGKAIGRALGKDMLRVLPLAFVWAIIWFVLTVLEALLSKSKKDSTADDTLTAQNAALTLANYGKFSFSEAFIEALQKGVRMVMFLILPAIAWDNLGMLKAIKKGLAVLRAHLGLFGSGYALTYAAAAVVFLPAVIIVELGTSHHGHPPLVHFPNYVWIATIIYMGFAWSLSMYLEQMFMAQLYLWHMNWEKEAAKALKEGRPQPAFETVPRPELLKKTPGLFADEQGEGGAVITP